MTSILDLLLVTYFCFTFQSVVEGSTFDGYFSDQVIQRVFHRSRDEIPRHEFVEIQTSEVHRSKREIRPVEIKNNYGETIFLNLSPIEDNVVESDVPMWLVKTDPQSDKYHSYQKLDHNHVEENGTFYQDAKNAATLFAYYKDRFIFYDGVVGESGSTKVVRSVPEKWWKATTDDQSEYHVVYDTEKDNTVTQILDEEYSRHSTGELDKPLEIMYPKLLVIVEYNIFKALGEDVDETLKYVATFWNAVNLKYQELTSPKIKIKVTGIIIEKDMTALRYIYDNIDKTKINTMKYSPLNKQMYYFKGDFGLKVDFKNYDSTITMVNLDCGILAGQAYPGQICGSGSNVGFVKDDASFSGLLPAIHELGHLLNMHHDGDGTAGSCKSYPISNTQTVMAPFNGNTDKTIWSECSKKVLKEFAKKKSAECMRKPYRESRL